MALFIEDFEEEPISSKLNRKLLNQIENIENGTMIIIRDINIYQLKIFYQNTIHKIDINIATDTV